MRRRGSRRAIAYVLIALVALSLSGWPAAAADPGMDDARLEGTFLADAKSGTPSLRLTPLCDRGSCAVEGEAYMPMFYGHADGPYEWQPVKVAYQETNYTATVTYVRKCEAVKGEHFLDMPTTWRAVFNVVEAGYVENEWRAISLGGDQQFTSPLVSQKTSSGYGECEDNSPAFPFRVDLDISEDLISSVPSEVPVPTEAALPIEAAAASEASPRTEAPIPTEAPRSTEAPPPEAPRRDADIPPDGTRVDAGPGRRAEPARPPAQRPLEVAPFPEPLFARAVTGVSEVPTDLEDLLRSLVLVLLLIPLIVFPSHLFNSTIEANYDEIRGWFRRRPTSAPPVDPLAISTGSRWRGWPGFLGFTLASSILYGFLDPAFGWNRASALQLLILLLSTVILTLAFAVPTRRYMKKVHADEGYLKVLPGALVFALICVIASRLAQFQPGYFYGVIAGFAFTRTLSKPDEGKAAARAGAFLLVLALAAWGVMSTLSLEGASLAPAVLRAVLGGLFVGGVEGLVFGMLPLRFMSGEKLWAWNKPLWTALMGAGLFIFVHVLLNPEAEYLANPNYIPLGTVVGLFATFGMWSVAFWAYFRYRRTPTSG
jgi:hypothetical protein